MPNAHDPAFLNSNINLSPPSTDGFAGEELSLSVLFLDESTCQRISDVSVIYQNLLNDRFIGSQNECIGEADGEDGLNNVSNSPHASTPLHENRRASHCYRQAEHTESCCQQNPLVDRG